MDHFSFATFQEPAKLLSSQDALCIVPNHFATQDGVSGPISHLNTFKGSVVYVVVHVALQDRPRAFVAWIPNGEIGIVARRDTTLPPVQTVQLGWVRRRQLHEARKAEAGFVCWLAGWRLVEQQRQPRL